MYLNFYKFRIISIFRFCNIFVVLENPCNIDFATFGRFFKFLATFFCNIYVAKNGSLQHFLMLQEKVPMLQKKKTYAPSTISMFVDFSSALQGGPLINVFLRVYFDVIQQRLRFNFHQSKQHSFFSPIEIYIPDRVDTSHHLRMNFTFSWGGGDP